MTASTAPARPPRTRTRIYDDQHDFAAACIIGSDGTTSFIVDSGVTKISRPIVLKELRRRAATAVPGKVVIITWADPDFCRLLDAEDDR